METIGYAGEFAALGAVLVFLALVAVYSNRHAKDAVVKTIWWLLPNYVDLVIYIHLGPLYVTFIEISTDGENPDYSPNPEREYMPKVALLEIQHNKVKKSHFYNRHCLIGYELITDIPEPAEDDDEAPAVYWHTFSLMFMDFYLPAKGPFSPAESHKKN
ncbi:hypothetical protein [Larkinella sp.]|uniref:hypothetical protein n=1 Tax=Larkinella sp. TaxID=2034517 RepID=UPI003BA93258